MLATMEGMLEQAHAEFGLQHPGHHAVQQSHVRLTGDKFLFQFIRVSLGHGQLHIQAGSQAAQTRVAHGFADALIFMSVAGSAVIGNGDSLKAHFVPQDAVQVMLGGMDGQAVQGAVTGHNAFQPGLGNGRLEGFAVDFQQQPIPGVYMCAMDSSSGIVEAEKMLGSGVRGAARGFGLLDAVGVGRAQGGSQGGVFAVGLALTAHAGIPGRSTSGSWAACWGSG